jgi:hypothetical protein
MRDRSRLWLATAVLFVLGAWPLLLCDVPPLEDLPAHLATSVVIRHPELYPNFVFHGFFKTNATLFLWLQSFDESHLVLASKLFVAIVVFAHAWVFPRLVVEIGGRERLVAGTLLAAPLVHNWFVAMGMLDFALASALGLHCVVLIARQMREPTRARAIAIGAMGLVVWYAHAFALGFVVLLALVEIARKRGVAIRAAAPLALALVVAIASAGVDVVRAGTALQHDISYRPPWEMVYELFAKYAWSFRIADAISLASVIALVASSFRERKLETPMLSMTTGLVLLVFVFVVPHEALGWGNVSVRALPFLYAIALVRAPADPPRAVTGAIAAAAVAWSCALGLAYRALTADFRELAAGTEIVPNGADVLPLVFSPKGSSDNTWALDHAWGLYVLAKHTSAPMLFAHLPGHPVGYRTPPDDEHPLRIEREVQRGDAAELSRIAPRHAWVLVFGKAPDGLVLPDHHVAFERGRLRLYSR